MGFAFSHLITAWLGGKSFEFLTRRKISHYTWFFILLGGILPDADFLIDWTLGTEIHRTFTHSLFFLLVAPLLLYIIFSLLKDKDSFSYAYALGGGILVHLILDMILSQGIPLFWPNLLHFTFTSVNYFDPATPSFLHQNVDIMRRAFKWAILEMALGIAWIFWLWWRRRIRF